MTENQLAEIRKYLLSKKLPIDILLEVQDHFVLQITKSQNEDELSFEESLLISKKNWEKDFKMVKKSWFSFEKIPFIVKQYQDNNDKKFLQKSFLIVALIVCFQMITTYFLDKEIYTIIQVVPLTILKYVLPLAILLLYTFLNWKKVFIHQKDEFYTANIPVFLILVALYFAGKTYYLPTNSMKIIYEFLQFGNYNFVDFVTAILQNSISTFIYIYVFFILKNRMSEKKRYHQFLQRSF